MVKINTTTINFEEVSLFDGNLHTQDAYRNNLSSKEVNIGGVHFFVFTDRTSEKIVGAMIDRNYHPLKSPEGHSV